MIQLWISSKYDRKCKVSKCNEQRYIISGL